MALGGNADKSGALNQSMFIKVVKDDFGMTLDLDQLIEDLDID